MPLSFLQAHFSMSQVSEIRTPVLSFSSLSQFSSAYIIFVELNSWNKKKNIRNTVDSEMQVDSCHFTSACPRVTAVDSHC